jgi:MFS family permease
MKEYTKIERIKLSILAYSLTFITGIAVVLPFVVKDAAATEFHNTLAHTGYIFSLFMLGMLVAQLANGFIIKFISLKTEIFLIAGIYIANMIAMYCATNITELIPVFLTLGFGFGALVTIPFYIINHSFDGRHRSTHMNLLDLFFAIGSFCFPILAGQLLADHINWKTLYLLALLIWAFIIILLLFTKLPNVNTHSTNENTISSNFSPWNLNVYLIGLAILFAFTSFMGLTYWLYTFLKEYLHMSIQLATLGVSFFWAFYGGGCLVAGIVLMYMKVNKYILLSAMVAIISYIFIYYSPNNTVLFIAISTLGLGCSTIYGSSIAYGTMLIKNPSPRLVSFFITSSGVGTYVAEFYSSSIQAKFGIPTLIVFSGIFMIMVLLIILYISISEKYKKRIKKSTRKVTT